MLLPLVNKSSGGGGISPTPEDKVYLYKNGVWNIGYSNPGSFKYSGSTPNGFTLDTNKFVGDVSSGGVQIIGVEDIDLTNYISIHFRGKGIRINGTSCGLVYITTTYDYDNYIARAFVTTVGSEVDYLMDISSITGTNNLCFLCNDNRSFEIYEIYLAPKQPKYIIKDGEYISGSMSWDYNIIGNTGTTNPVSIVNKDGYIEIKKNFGYTWTECRASAYVENIGISIANGDMIHMRAKISTTANFGASGHLRIGSVNTKSTSRTYYGSATLNVAETITDFAYKNTLNNPPVIVLPEFNKPTTASGISGTITMQVYDLYVI